MANRVIRDWTDSERMNDISFQAEVVFTRLTMKADDYGSFHGNVKLVKAAIFPLKSDTIREADVSRWMDELQKAGLIVFYESDSKQFLRILNFGQRLRTMKKRFPDLPADNPPRSAAIRRELRPEGEVETEVQSETETEGEVHAHQKNGFLIFDFEKYLLEHQKDFEAICIAHQKSEEFVKNVLQKYHLWNQENEKYPRPPLALIAGFKKWLLNEKNFTKNGNDQNNVKPGKSASAEKLTKWLDEEIRMDNVTSTDG